MDSIYLNPSSSYSVKNLPPAILKFSSQATGNSIIKYSADQFERQSTLPTSALLFSGKKRKSGKLKAEEPTEVGQPQQNRVVIQSDNSNQSELRKQKIIQNGNVLTAFRQAYAQSLNKPLPEGLEDKLIDTLKKNHLYQADSVHSFKNPINQQQIKISVPFFAVFGGLPEVFDTLVHKKVDWVTFKNEVGQSYLDLAEDRLNSPAAQASKEIKNRYLHIAEALKAIHAGKKPLTWDGFQRQQYQIENPISLTDPEGSDVEAHTVAKKGKGKSVAHSKSDGKKAKITQSQVERFKKVRNELASLPSEISIQESPIPESKSKTDDTATPVVKIQEKYLNSYDDTSNSMDGWTAVGKDGKAKTPKQAEVDTAQKEPALTSKRSSRSHHKNEQKGSSSKNQSVGREWPATDNATALSAFMPKKTAFDSQQQPQKSKVEFPAEKPKTKQGTLPQKIEKSEASNLDANISALSRLQAETRLSTEDPAAQQKPERPVDSAEPSAQPQSTPTPNKKEKPAKKKPAARLREQMIPASTLRDAMTNANFSLWNRDKRLNETMQERDWGWHLANLHLEQNIDLQQQVWQWQTAYQMERDRADALTNSLMTNPIAEDSSIHQADTRLEQLEEATHNLSAKYEFIRQLLTPAGQSTTVSTLLEDESKSTKPPTLRRTQSH
jgi:hypothetical protein